MIERYQPQHVELVRPRRRFLRSSAMAMASISIWRFGGTIGHCADIGTDPRFAERVEGLLIGTLIGDAIGGPIEFQSAEAVGRLSNGPKVWQDDELLDESQMAQLANRFGLHDYTLLRPDPEPYAHWTRHASAGTVTDDSRHKMILLDSLRTFAQSGRKQFTACDLARSYLGWRDRAAIAEHDGYVALCDEWLDEYALAARWVLGNRDLSQALPTERLWNGLPTCCGQMTLPVLAAIFSGDAPKAYDAAYKVGFHDNGWGKDINASLVAGLAQALVVSPKVADRNASWGQIVATMRSTDPYRHAKVPWTERAIDRWLKVADTLVDQADGRPARLFARLDEVFADTVKWEAQVPIVVAYATAKMCDFQPVEAMQLCLEWGEDTDSYAQLLGAFLGALHGPGIFPSSIRQRVTERLQLDYGESLSEWGALLLGLRQRALSQNFFDWPPL